MTVEAQPSTELGFVDESFLGDQDPRKLVGPVQGSPYQTGDGLFADWLSGDVYDRGDPNAAGIDLMLDSDGTARQLEQVLTLPIRAAEHSLVGGSERGRALINDQLDKPRLDHIIAQETSAIAFRKAFFELSWEQDGSSVRLTDVAFRPAASCQAAFNEKGRPIGFRQRIANPGNLNGEQWRRVYAGEMPGWARITKQRSFIYTHGSHRQPLKGVSDLSVAWWAYETRKKLMYLWLSYIEQQSHPKTAVYGKTITDAQINVREFAKLRAGGFIPAKRPDDPQAKAFEILETAGHGATLFEPAVRYLEAHMTDSVLAGFAKLASGAATTGSGSRALSEDATNYFQMSRQAVADEQSYQTATGLFAPICVYNNLTRADIPMLRIGPLSKLHLEQSMAMLTTLLTAEKVNAPDEFLDSLLTIVAPTLGLDAGKLAEAITKYRSTLERERAEMAKQTAQQGPPAPRPGQPRLSSVPAPRGQRPGAPDDKAANLANEVDAAFGVVSLAQQLGDADAAVAALMGHPSVQRTHIDLAAAPAGNGSGGESDDAKSEHTGGMVALLPDAESARKLVIEGGEPADQLHVTLAYLGDDVTGWTDSQREQVLARARAVAGHTEPVDARAFAHATFNPDAHADRQPCAVYLIGDTDRIPELHLDFRGLASALQHPGFVAHLTGAYGKKAEALTYTGPVRFDRLVVALGGDWTELPLTGRRGGDLDERPMPHG